MTTIDVNLAADRRQRIAAGARAVAALIAARMTHNSEGEKAALERLTMLGVPLRWLAGTAKK